MSIVTQPAHASLAEAKAALIDAAKAIDPLAPMRRRPFISVGVAAGVGAFLGMNRGRLIAPGTLTRAISSFVRPVAFAVGRYVMARASRRATETRKEPARTSAPT
ncbi:MAG: hypothetical protein ABR964_04145 [Tepidisphaeraceae bacterium]|jgi:hypothetical protein